MAESKFKNTDEKIFRLAGVVDASLRFHSLLLNLTDLEREYAENKLNQEQDPVLAAVYAQVSGKREIPDKEDAD
jgi:hypothetical protein